jgi:8-oxo-dGTP pyrophosphatase MutT (NUDIX family)
MESKSSSSEVSAGGFVISKTDGSLVALMARFNRGGKLEWCIPKGHLEADETKEQAALREVFEETGLEAKIIDYLGRGELPVHSVRDKN